MTGDRCRELALTLALSLSALSVLALILANTAGIVAQDEPARGSAEVEALAVPAYSGLLDENFGSGGIVTTVFASGEAQGRSMALQPDGRIVVAGANRQICPALARFHPNGSLDTSFGTNGLANTRIGSRGQGYAVAVQPDNRIVLAGYGGQSYFALVRYRPHLAHLPHVSRQYDLTWWATD